MSLRNVVYYPMTALSSATSTPMIFAQDFRNVVFTLMPSSFTGTIKFYTSNQESRPDLTASASSTNQYSLVEVITLADGLSVAGSTGISYTASSTQATVEVNTNYQRWVGITCTAYTSGSIGLSASLSDNL